MSNYSKYDKRVSVQQSSHEPMYDNGTQIMLTEPSSIENKKYQQSNHQSSPGGPGANEDIVVILP